MKKTQKFPVLMSALVTVPLVLAGCSSTSSEAPAVDSSAATAAASPASATPSSESAASDSAVSDSAASDDDPVFDIIDIVLAEYPDGIITDIDREDNTDTYDVDVVVGQEVIELNVSTDGSLRIDEREGDDDDIAEANAATVSAAQAIGQALSMHPDGVVDEVELNEDDGRLEWDVELDDASRNDLASVTIPAN
ncbi:hypothetical protein CDES_00670 [Corynebacterium deserti GIMN1.010]|uniref:PepSY domain-containing protein n=1 Tax=Corynebacterium deserti GIMN1.010 TaxID=931089 RepID=A0A0M4CHE5_9CORY|nr:PepSY domain-containing protein [Corynebacterium deserti]ALC04614.1 hypothetical protein CDES_00670 [Corynebacterium deserti GIMN1.010]